MRFFLSTIVFIAFSWTALGQYKILQMSPPQAKKYLKSQLARMDDVRKYKHAGHIGEADDAMLAIRDIKTLPAAEQEKVKKIVADENKDRKSIYQAIAKFNKLNEKEKKMLIDSAYETYRNTDAKETYHFEKKKWIKKY